MAKKYYDIVDLEERWQPIKTCLERVYANNTLPHKVLDIGCNTGKLTNKILQFFSEVNCSNCRYDPNLTIIEEQADAYTEAVNYLQQKYLNFSAYQKDVRKLVRELPNYYPLEHFNAIFALGVLHKFKFDPILADWIFSRGADYIFIQMPIDYCILGTLTYAAARDYYIQEANYFTTGPKKVDSVLICLKARNSGN